MMKLFTVILFLFSCLQSATDSDIVVGCLGSLSQHKDRSTGNLTVQSALYFSGKPYAGNTLEINEEESLVINLKEFDCTTLVETSLAMSLTAQSANPGFTEYCNNLQKIRYRNGKIEGYTSRLHYSSDWIDNNVSKGFIRDITKECGGKKFPLNLRFMSEHPDAYKQLKAHPGDVEKIRQIEDNINKKMHYYIPKESISACTDKIKTGDIVFFVTSVPGLDISHMGIAYWKDGKLTFIHASTKAMKVIVNPDPLTVYCNSNKSNKGIMVCRPQISPAVNQ